MIFQISLDVSNFWIDCLDLIDAPGVVDCVLDPPLGSSDHSSISFTLQLGFCIPSITFSRQVYLKSCVDWSRVRQDLQESTYGNVYNITITLIQLMHLKTYLSLLLVVLKGLKFLLFSALFLRKKLTISPWKCMIFGTWVFVWQF